MLNRLKDVFASLQNHEVNYLVIGGIAAVLHGVPRTTFDLDILIKATPGNAECLLNAFREAELGTASLISPKELIEQEITVFKDRVRIDFQTQTPGLTFESAWKNAVTMKYRDQEFYVASREDLIQSKKASGREVDLEDARLLQQNDTEEEA